MGYKASSSSSSPSSSSSLAPGFRFHPTDEELVIYYLKRKICGRPFRVDAISDIDIYKFEPWDLPDRSRLKSRDLEWYFFSALDKKYGNGWRTNRATDQGYWKTTGKDRTVRRSEKTVGMKKTLVFHLGRAPHGERTNWVMHEYRLADEDLSQAGIVQDAFVLCRVFRKSGPGPKNGEQYGAPFVDEEWEDNELVLKSELDNDVYCGLGDNGYAQQQDDYKEDHILASIPQNDFLVGTDSGNGSNHLENPGGSFEDDQKVFIGTGENVGLPELPDEKLFILPEQFEMDQTPNENEYFSFEDFLNTEDDNNHAENPVDGELTFLDAPQYQPVVNGSFIAVDPNSSEADQNPFELLNDEYLNYFDAIEDSNFVDLNSSQVAEDGVPQSVFTEEWANTEYKQACLALPESPQINWDEGASSSEKKPEFSKTAGDVNCHNGWDSNLAKQVSRMLGSIPAPTAFAAEVPTKESAYGQNSTTHSSPSVHVTAGMIHISGMAIIGGEKIWSIGKSGNADLLLPYGLRMRDVSLIGNSFEPIGNTTSSKATTVMLRSGFYFMFLWVLILSVSCKIGSYIYAR